MSSLTLFSSKRYKAELVLPGELEVISKELPRFRLLHI